MSRFQHDPQKVLAGISWHGGPPAKLERRGRFVSYGPTIFGMLNPIEFIAWKFFGRIPYRFHRFLDLEYPA